MGPQRMPASFTPGASGPQHVVARTDVPDQLAPGMHVELLDEASALVYDAVVLSVIDDHHFEALVGSVSRELGEVQQPPVQPRTCGPVPHVDAHMPEAFRFT